MVGGLFELLLGELGLFVILELGDGADVQRLEGVAGVLHVAVGAQDEVVPGVVVGCHVQFVLDQLQEQSFHLVDVLGLELREGLGEVLVLVRLVVPHLDMSDNRYLGGNHQADHDGLLPVVRLDTHRLSLGELRDVEQGHDDHLFLHFAGDHDVFDQIPDAVHFGHLGGAVLLEHGLELLLHLQDILALLGIVGGVETHVLDQVLTVPGGDQGTLVGVLVFELTHSHVLQCLLLFLALVSQEGVP